MAIEGGDSGTATAAATPVNAQDTDRKLTRGTVTAPIERDVASASAAKPQPAALAVNDLIKQGNDLYSKFQAGLEKAKADMPSGPNLQPWNQKMPEADPARAFGSWASVLGILAGALTRQPLTAALNASGQAMKAIRSNDIAAYEDAKQTWKENTDIAIKNAEWSYKQYQAGLDLMKTDYDAGAAHIKTTAALIGDIHTMQNDDARTAAAMAESKQRLAMQGLQISEAMGAHYDAMMAGVDLYNQQRRTNPQMPEFKDLSPQQQSAWTSRGAREIAVQDKLRTAKMAETDRLRSAIMAQHPDWDETKVAAETQRIQHPVRDTKTTKDDAALDADIRAAHKDWTDGQVVAERERQKAELKAKGGQQGRQEAADVPSPIGGDPVVPNTGGLTQSALDRASMEYILNGGSLPTPPRGAFASTQMTAIRNQAAKLADQIGLTPQDVAALPAERKAGASALLNDIKFRDGVKNGLYLFENMFPIAEKYAKKLSLTEIRSVNNAILKGKIEFGDPDANNYANAMATIALEYGRITAGPSSNAMAPVELMKIGMDRLGPNITPAQFEGEKKLVHEEATAKLEASDRTIAEQRRFLRAPVAGGASLGVTAAGTGAVPPAGPAAPANSDPLGIR